MRLMLNVSNILHGWERWCTHEYFFVCHNSHLNEEEKQNIFKTIPIRDSSSSFSLLVVVLFITRVSVILFFSLCGLWNQQICREGAHTRHLLNGERMCCSMMLWNQERQILLNNIHITSAPLLRSISLRYYHQ